MSVLTLPRRKSIGPVDIDPSVKAITVVRGTRRFVRPMPSSSGAREFQTMLMFIDVSERTPFLGSILMLPYFFRNFNYDAVGLTTWST